MSLNTTIQMKNHFDVILGITSQANIYFHYYVGISYSLQSTTEEIYKVCPVFWNETKGLYYYSCIECLMRLYDLTRRNGGLINFLDEIKDQFQEPVLIKDINNFLDTINQDYFIILRYNLREIRNKKFFHIDPENARGEYESKRAKRILMLNIAEKPNMNDPEYQETIYLSPDQNGNLSALLFYKEVNRFLSFSML